VSNVIRSRKKALPPASSSLRVSKPESPSEHEANRVANQAVSGEKSQNYGWSFSNINVESPVETAPPIVDDALRSPGKSLSPASRAVLEPELGRDLSDIRVHTDEKAAESAQAVGARAYTVGADIVVGSEAGSHGPESDRHLLAHELTHTLQQERSGVPLLQRQPAPQPELKLVDDFGAKFSAAAALIKPNPAAMKLVKEAFDAGTTFGGFAEDGPDKTSGRAYTAGNAVYVPKARGKVPVEAMSDFLFELNNAIRGPKYAALAAAAAKGKKTDTAAAKQYAHDIVEGEVEGMLRLGEVWFETKAKYLGKQAHSFDQYDSQFFLSEYQSVKDKKKTKEDVIKDVLTRKYETGALKGKTVEQNYMEQYEGYAK
jgi:hypothetical protein